MTKTAAEDLTHPTKILHDQRIAQAELRHVAGTRLRRELGEAFRAEDGDQRIAWQHAQHEEHDDRDADHRDRTEGETTQDVAVHKQRVRFLWRRC